MCSFCNFVIVLCDVFGLVRFVDVMIVKVSFFGEWLFWIHFKTYIASHCKIVCMSGVTIDT